MAYDDPQCVKMSKDLLYEIEMLYALRSYFTHRVVDNALAGLDDDGLPARNALIEAFAVHARNLQAFIRGKRGYRGDDPIAKDYLVGRPKAFHAARKAASSFLDGDLENRINQQVVHFSGKRHASLARSPAWDYADICDNFSPILQAFAADAEPTRVRKDFRARLAAATVSIPPAPQFDPTKLSIITSQQPTSSVPTQALNQGGTIIVRPDDPPLAGE